MPFDLALGEFVPPGRGDISPAFQRRVFGPIWDKVPNGTTDSVPEVTLVKRDAVPLQKSHKLLLKAFGSMVFSLVLDVMNVVSSWETLTLKAPYCSCQANRHWSGNVS